MSYTQLHFNLFPPPPQRSQAEQDADWLHRMFTRHPPHGDELLIIPEGVRLARFVPPSECQHCSFASSDHRLHPNSTICICLKDLAAHKKEARRKP